MAGVIFLQLVVIFLWTFFTVGSLWKWFSYKPLRYPEKLKRKPKIEIPGESKKLWPRLLEPTKMDKLAWSLRWGAGKYPKNLMNQLLLVVLGSVLLMVLGYYFYAGVLVVLLAGFLAGAIKQSERAQKEFVKVLPGALDTVVQSMRAGFPFYESISVAAKETGGYVGNAFASIFRAYQYRMDFAVALDLLDRQIDLHEWSMVSDMLLVAERSGGDVTGILSQVSQTLRDKYEVEEEVLTATASGRASAVIISVLAPGVFFIFYMMSPEYMDPLIKTTIGNLLLMTALVLELIGVYIVRQIMKVDF